MLTYTTNQKIYSLVGWLGFDGTYIIEPVTMWAH